jgi:hypothetical protein
VRARRFHAKIPAWYDGIFINIYYLGLTVRSQTLAPLILPLLVQQFVAMRPRAAAMAASACIL